MLKIGFACLAQMFWLVIPTFLYSLIEMASGPYLAHFIVQSSQQNISVWTCLHQY